MTIFLFYLDENSKIKLFGLKFYLVNFILFSIFLSGISIVLSDKISLLIFTKIFIFVLFSFFISSILIIFLSIYNQLKNKKKILNKFEKLSLLLLFFFLLILFQQKIIPSFFLIFVLTYPLIKIVKSFDTEKFTIEKKIKDLSVGDWMAKDIKKNSKAVFKKKELTLGIQEDQIKKLKKIFGENHKVLVKEGIPFVPIMFLSFLLILALSFLN